MPIITPYRFIRYGQGHRGRSVPPIGRAGARTPHAHAPRLTRRGSSAGPPGLLVVEEATVQHQLTDQDREILDALAGLPDLSERTATAVLEDRFGNLTLLWQHVNALLNCEAALAYQPALVARLQRRRSTGRRGHHRAT